MERQIHAFSEYIGMKEKQKIRYFSNDEMFHPEGNFVYILYLNDLKYTQRELIFINEVLHAECIMVNMNG